LVDSHERRGRQCLNDGRYDGFRNCIARDPVFLPLLTNDSTVPVVVQLLSPNIQLHTSHLIYKKPDPDGAESQRREPGWHRDINTSPTDVGYAALPRMEIKVAYQLSDASTPGCGQTLVAPGSHLLHEPLQRPNGRDPERWIEPLLEPGDAMLFENRTWHAGGANRCGRTRKVVMFGYSYHWLRPDDYVEQNSDLIQHCDPIGRQLLGGTGRLTATDGSFNAAGSERPLVEWCRKHRVDPGWRHTTLSKPLTTE
jgi:ectoine hydroxylase-related dioxygenase (phytanoyl-CoA dioxygenase family)